MVADARDRTKVWLDTYLTGGNMLIDDGLTEASFITCYADPPYPMRRVFLDKDIDLIFTVDHPISTPVIGHAYHPYMYDENVPITTFCIDKIGVSGTKLLWTSEAELRRIAEDYPEGSIRSITDRRDNTKHVGTTTPIYSTRFTLNYQRDTT